MFNSSKVNQRDHQLNKILSNIILLLTINYLNNVLFNLCSFFNDLKRVKFYVVVELTNFKYTKID